MGFDVIPDARRKRRVLFVDLRARNLRPARLAALRARLRRQIDGVIDRVDDQVMSAGRLLGAERRDVGVDLVGAAHVGAHHQLRARGDHERSRIEASIGRKRLGRRAGRAARGERNRDGGDA